ncbi:MAG: PHP domain-containing protein [Thermomicrobiales bacterium]|jgi:predicted metal-dependent phosphoesterase TrpH
MDETKVMAGAAVDLHMHTRVSDGRWTPETLVARVAELGLGVMAIADHDALDSVVPGRALAAARGITLVSGVEVTTRWDGRQWHLLVYGADPEHGQLHDLVARQRQRHIDRANEAIARARQRGYELPALDEIIGGRPPLPIYVMNAVIRAGYATSHLTANQFVANTLGVPFYIDVPIQEAVAAAHASHALAIVAHPGRREDPDPMTAERLPRLLAETPIDGLEAYYPTHTPEQVAAYAALAERYDLLCSCGSDSHGPDWPRDPIAYPVDRAAPLLARLGVTTSVR